MAKRPRIAELRIAMPESSLQRFKAMQQAAEASATEVASDAFRMYEEALHMATNSEEEGGVVYLVVKYPDGRHEEKPVFKQEQDA